MRRILVSVFCLLAIVSLIACGPATSAPPTNARVTIAGPTPAPTATSQPTAKPTATPTPPTETPAPTLGPVLVGTPVPPPAVAISAENAAQVRQLARWGRGAIRQIAWSPDGKTLAVGTSVAVYLHDVTTMEEIRTLATGSDTRSMVFTPDGALLVVATENGVQVWQIADGTLLRTIEGREVLLSQNGELAVADAELWSTVDGTHLRTLEQGEYVAISPDGTVLASTENGSIQLWRATNGTRLQMLPQAGDSGTFSRDGAILATQADNQVQLWQVADGKLRDTIAAKGNISFSPDGAFLAVWRVRTLELWQVADGTLLRATEPDGFLMDIAWSPDSRVLAASLNTIAEGDHVQLWQVTDGAAGGTLEGFRSSVRLLVFSSDGPTLAAGSDDGSLRTWQMSAGTSKTVHGYELGEALVLSPDGALLARVTWDGVIEFRRAADGTIIRTIEGSLEWGSFGRVAFLQDGTALVSTWGDRSVRLWLVADGTLLNEWQPTAGNVDALSSDATVLVVRTGLDTIQVLKTADGAVVSEATIPQARKFSLSPDGQLLAVTTDGPVELRRVADGKLLRTLPLTDVTGLTFSPDGQMLAGVTGDGSIQFLQVADGKLAHTIEEAGLDDGAFLSFSPDGEILAAGSWGQVGLWRVRDGTGLATLQMHSDTWVLPTFSSDGTVLFTLGWDDGTIRLWGVNK